MILWVSLFSRLGLIIVNCVGAKEYGWKEVCHLLFPEDPIPAAENGIRQIRDLNELREIYPQMFLNRHHIDTRWIGNEKDFLEEVANN
jgi:hypothetical protein